MRKNSPALLKRSLLLVLLASLFASAGLLSAQELSQDDVEQPAEYSVPFQRNVSWYRSNAAGLALEFVPSRLAAMRGEFCLSTEQILPAELPEILLPYYNGLYRIEKRTLYENREESRCQYIFRDNAGLARLVASGRAGFWVSGEEEDRAGFIEFRNSEGLIESELRFEENLSEWKFYFFYSEGVLLNTETWFREAPDSDSSSGEDEGEENMDEDPAAIEKKAVTVEREFVKVSTDYYLYSRIGSLRSIDRHLHEAAAQTRVVFPRIGSGFFAYDEMMAYGIAHNSQFLADIRSPEGVKVSYSLDGRGRILGEVWKNDDDEVLGEFTNIWSGDRLKSILWKSPNEERLVEYDYDSDGNRITERNFNRGVLERRVTTRGDLDTEEIFMEGMIILRAVWEKGVKIFEERLFFGGERN